MFRIECFSAARGDEPKFQSYNENKYVIPNLMHKWKDASEGRPRLVVTECNNGEGSTREHVALQLRFLGSGIVVCKSFVRIRETNIKKQSLVPLMLTARRRLSRVGKPD